MHETSRTLQLFSIGDLDNRQKRDESKSMNDLNDRKIAEAEFHNKRALERIQYEQSDFETRWSNKKFYSITRRSKGAIEEWLSSLCPGSKALDYCCGQGLTTIKMASLGAFAYGIDIADAEIETARRQVEDAGVADQTKFLVMDAEELDFEDNFFDLIVCNGVLHHLDVERAFPELSRVLKPSGQILCIEALAYNPLINYYRRKTRHLRTEWEIDHILSLKEVDLARRYFRGVETSFYHLFSILAVPFRNTRLFSPILSILEFIDGIVLRVPLLQLMAWQMIFTLSQPGERQTHSGA